MVQQLSLFSAIDDESYDLCISTLATLSGKPPILFSSFSAMFKPNPSYEIERVNSKNQLVEQNRIKLCKELSINDFSQGKYPKDYNLLKQFTTDDLANFDISKLTDLMNGSSDPDKMDVDECESSISGNSWCLNISDIPSAGGNRSVSMQSITESIILSSGGSSASIISFLSELGYILDFQNITLGVKLNMANDVCLELSKIWHLDGQKTVQKTKGGFLIKAYVNVAKGTDIKSINQGISSLASLQKDLSGYIDLEIPDRKAMDSRLDNLDDI
ncbi:LAFE_0D05732g1_1 [Lachancea fermentati]|uniref:Mediator of RNA polymerase II transcription subunit 18 n=1 Tax=Lachancea fermentati TaxID=4955 RepID=A0A1G4MB63_LACFM|nr:LAFE_0D05732g1_1 [Lachancea fermentati]